MSIERAPCLYYEQFIPGECTFCCIRASAERTRTLPGSNFRPFSRPGLGRTPLQNNSSSSWASAIRPYRGMAQRPFGGNLARPHAARDHPVAQPRSHRATEQIDCKHEEGEVEPVARAA